MRTGRLYRSSQTQLKKRERGSSMWTLFNCAAAVTAETARETYEDSLLTNVGLNLQIQGVKDPWDPYILCVGAQMHTGKNSEQLAVTHINIFRILSACVFKKATNWHKSFKDFKTASLPLLLECVKKRERDHKFNKYNLFYFSHAKNINT